MTGVTSGTGTAYPSRALEFTLVFSEVCVTRFSFIRMLCRSLFVLLYFFIWPLCCLFLFDIRILITPLVSSNSLQRKHIFKGVRVMVLNTIFNNISVYCGCQFYWWRIPTTCRKSLTNFIT